jgi:D-alanyl-lipoteichoic acid acyltransferase DltB (MBOAT superfamily)
VRFNSLIYFAFFAVVLAVTWSLPARARKIWLLVASCAFYASWHPPYLLLLVAAAALNHFGSRWIVAGERRAPRGAVIIALTFAPLVVFKYAGWLATTANVPLALFGWQLPVPHWLLPLGISFYLFECVSFTVDVVRKREKPHTLVDFLFFVAFFPKLIAGPILRAKELLPQLQRDRAISPEQAGSALRLIVTGLFIKTVLADGIAQAVDTGFSHAADRLGTLDAWVLAFGFGLQIYFDFSSYSRLAIGSARLLGFELVENFDHPYAATSPADFWARWHMSLSRWIRDYVFYPLVGRKTSLPAMMRAAILSMTVCGIWHGAGWGFVLWGLWHGLMVAGYHLVNFKRRGLPATKLRSLAGWAVTLPLVMLGWLLFRASSATDGLVLIARAFDPRRLSTRDLSGTFYLQVALLTGAVLAASQLAKPVAKAWEAPRGPLFGMAEGAILGLLLTVSLIYLRGQTAFIYFQF